LFNLHFYSILSYKFSFSKKQLKSFLATFEYKYSRGGRYSSVMPVTFSRKGKMQTARPQIVDEQFVKSGKANPFT